MTETLFPTSARNHFRHATKKVESPVEWGALTVGSVLLSIDPSIARCGFAILLKTERDPIRLASGIIKPQERGEMDRFSDLAFQIMTLATGAIRYNGVEHRPTDAIIEIPWGVGRGGRPMLDYARAVGACEAACALAGLGMNRARANQWKPNAAASKGNNILLVKQTFGYAPADHNESDAIMLGAFLCWKRI